MVPGRQPYAVGLTKLGKKRREMRRYLCPLGRVGVAQCTSKLGQNCGIRPCLHFAQTSHKSAGHFDAIQTMNVDGMIASIQQDGKSSSSAFAGQTSALLFWLLATHMKELNAEFGRLACHGG